MILIKKEEANKKQNSNLCTVWEYEYPNKNSSFATALINGRYPEEKRSVNLKCDQVYYVISGNGTIHSEGGDFNINPGDLYYFDKGEKYWIQGTNLFVVISNTPKWEYEQYAIVD